MSEEYVISYPRNVVFGVGALDRLPTALPMGSRRVLLVAGAHFMRSPEAAKLTAALDGRLLATVSDIPAEPCLAAVDKLLEIGRSGQADAVVAVGGGSVLDAAKTAAALIPLPGMTADYFHGRLAVSGQGLFCAAAPTTAGTGAEITRNAVLIEPETKIKKSIKHDALIPDLALIDPALTLSCPPGQTVSSGLDAFVQAVESYLTLHANAVSRALALGAVNLLFNHLETAAREPGDLAARTKVAEGSLLSAMSFSQCGLGAVHGLAHPIGALLGVPHGLTCAILLLPVLKWNLRKKQEDYAGLAKVCGGATPDDFINTTKDLLRSLQVPAGFSAMGLTKEHFPFIIKHSRSGSMASNPRPMSDQDIEDLLAPLAH